MIRRIHGLAAAGAGLLALAALAACGGGEVPPPQPPPPPPVVAPPPPPPPPAAPPVVPLSGNRMSLHSGLDANFCLNVDGGHTGEGAPINLYTCKPSENETFDFGPGPDNSNGILGKSAKCVTAKPDGVALWSCNNQPNQMFKHYADGTLHDVATNSCLTAVSATNRGGVALAPCALPPPPAQVWNPTAAPPPPAATTRVVVNDERINLNEEILFKTGSAEIDPQSMDFVAFIAHIIKEHEGLDFIEVAGHADKRGAADANKILTQQRSEAVVKQLVAFGINPKRLRGVGYGAYCPVDPRDNDEAYAKNRRVEFLILRRNGKDLKTKWGGCDAAKAAGLKIAAIPATAPKTKELIVKKGRPMTRKGAELVFPDQVRFEPSTANIVPATEPALESLKMFLDKEKAVTKIRVEGHTDPPDNADMLALSKARSRKVAEWLVNHGVDPSRIIPVGCGGRRPIVLKGGVVDEARSRRTEAHIVEEKGKPVSAAVPADCAVD